MSSSNALIPAAEPTAPLTTLVRSTQPSDLAKALASARDKCKAAPHDRTNNFHHYNYASAESIINAAKEALEGTGLSLVPAAPKMTVLGTGNMAIYSLSRAFALIHASGETLPLGTIEWPVIPDKGRPLDKAFAVALTSSLAYVYRDLLLMPRVAADEDMAGRDDRHAALAPAPATRPTQPPPAPPAEQNQTLYEALQSSEDAMPISDAQELELAQLIRQTGTDGRKLCQAFGIPVLKKLPSGKYAEVHAELMKRVAAQTVPAPPANGTNGTAPAAAPQPDKRKLCDSIDKLIADLQIPEADFLAKIKADYGAASPAAMTLPQLVDVETRLKKKAEQVGGQPVGAGKS